MKRIVIILALALFATSLHAQTDTLPDTAGCGQAPRQFSINLGVSAGASLLFPTNDQSPYYSRYGFTLHIPLVAQWRFAPHWRLIYGLRYDFSWLPLYYNVESTADQGLAFRSTPTVATHHNHLFTSHVGIPVEIEWRPWTSDKNILSLSVDLFAGYAVNQSIILKEQTPSSAGDAVSRLKSPLQPWKVEVGFNVSSSLIGLIHGIRLFTNLLPTYVDPTTGSKIYSSGITMYL